MKNIFIIILFISIQSFSQENDTIRLSKLKLCELTLVDLKQKYEDLEQVDIEEMNLCSDSFVQDGRFENRIGYKTRFYPGVIFQKYAAEINLIAKIHLTKDFKGYLPDDIYVDLKSLKSKDIIEKYDDLDIWTSRGCSDYLGINKEEEFYFYVKLNKSKEPRYPIDNSYYSEEYIEGIDIVSDCFSFIIEKKSNSPLYIVDGKEVNEGVVKSLKNDDVESIIVLKDKSAFDKYGEKGKNGVIEIYLKKKAKKKNKSN